MIEMKDVNKSYGKLTVLEHVNFTFPKHGLICLLGASGCGKSTLLNLIAGFDSEYSGAIMYCGALLSNMSEEDLCKYRRNHIGFIFQEYHLLNGYTVLENVLLPCLGNTSYLSTDKDRAKALLAKIGMEHKENEKVENLSGGQKQRVAIARALMGNPSLLLVDEPAGALDRNSATQIMEILKELSQNHLVLVITHDPQICTYGDQQIVIENGKLIGEESNGICMPSNTSNPNNPRRNFVFTHGLKNFKVHIKRYIVVALAIAVGVSSLLMSLSFQNVMAQSIIQFKEKNIAYNNGYVKLENGSNVYDIIAKNKNIENVYYQYKIANVSLIYGDNKEVMSEKYPMPKTSQSFSFGGMPKTNKQEVVLSPSLAKKFARNISDLIGKEIILQYQEQEYKLTVSGIFNAGYDDFYVSSDIEQNFYKGLEKKNAYSISYDVTNFEKIVEVSGELQEKGINTINAIKEVTTLQDTFYNLSNLFLIVTILITSIGLFISIVLITKLQNSRYKEIGLYAALGFRKRSIRSMIIVENILLSLLAGFINATILVFAYSIDKYFTLNLSISSSQIVLSMVATSTIVILISMLASYKLIHTKPAIALRK